MQKVQELGTTEHEEIFKILKMREVEYSINKNGVFVNLTHITDDLFHMLNNFVTFCLDNKATLDEYDKAIIDRKFQANLSPAPVPAANGVSTAAVPTVEKGSVFSHSYSHAPTSTVIKAIRCDNSKFNQAKKRYTKKRSLMANNEVSTSKKGDMDTLGNDLHQECFLIQ